MIEIPLVDMRLLRDRKPSELAVLRSAMEKFGFVRVSNLPFSHAACEAVANAARGFFRHSDQELLSLVFPDTNHQIGLTPQYTEQALGANLPDPKRFFHFKRDMTLVNGALVNLPELAHGAAQHFIRQAEELFNRCDVVLAQFLSVLGAALDVGDNLLQVAHKGDSVLRSLWYPPQEGVLGGAHADINLITLLPFATASGLQVLGPDGEWIDILPSPHEVVVNAGDLLRYHTLGQVKSSIHRVIGVGDVEPRISTVFFGHPRREVELGVAGHVKYPRRPAGELVDERLVINGVKRATKY